MFGNNLDSSAIIRNDTKRAWTPFPPKYLQNCSLISQPGHWQFTHPYFLHFKWTYACIFSVPLVLCNFITHVGLCIHYYSHDTESPQGSLMVPFYNILPLSKCLPSLPDNHYLFSMFYNFVILKCYVNKTVHLYIMLHFWICYFFPTQYKFSRNLFKL